MGGSHTPGWLPKRQLLRPRISGAAAAEQAGRLPPPEDEGGTTGLQLRRKRKVHTRTAGPGARRQCLLCSPNLRSDGESKKKRNGKKTKKKALPRRRPSIHRDTGEATQTSPHGWQAGQWLLLRDSQGASSPFPRRGRKQPSNAPRLPLFSSRGGREEAVPFWARNHSGVAVRGQKKALGGTAGGTTRGP